MLRAHVRNAPLRRRAAARLAPTGAAAATWRSPPARRHQSEQPFGWKPSPLPGDGLQAAPLQQQAPAFAPTSPGGPSSSNGGGSGGAGGETERRLSLVRRLRAVLWRLTGWVVITVGGLVYVFWPQIAEGASQYFAALAAVDGVLAEPLPAAVLAALARQRGNGDDSGAGSEEEEDEEGEDGIAPTGSRAAVVNAVTVAPSSFLHRGTRVDVSVFRPPASTGVLLGTSAAAAAADAAAASTASPGAVGGSGTKHPVVINAGTVASARPYALALAQQGVTVIAYTHGGLTLPPSAASSASEGGGGGGPTSTWAPTQPQADGAAEAAPASSGGLRRRLEAFASTVFSFNRAVVQEAGDPRPEHTQFFVAPPPTHSPAAAAALGGDAAATGAAAAASPPAADVASAPAPPTSDAEADELVSVLRHVGVAVPVVMLSTGYNWLATLKAALRNKAYVAGCVLVDPLLPVTTHRLGLPLHRGGGTADGGVGGGGHGQPAARARVGTSAASGGAAGPGRPTGTHALDLAGARAAECLGEVADALAQWAASPEPLRLARGAAEGNDCDDDDDDDADAGYAALFPAVTPTAHFAATGSSGGGGSAGRAGPAMVPLPAMPLLPPVVPVPPPHTLTSGPPDSALAAYLALEAALKGIPQPPPAQDAEAVIRSALAVQPLKALVHPSWMLHPPPPSSPSDLLGRQAADLPDPTGSNGIGSRIAAAIEASGVEWFGHDAVDAAYYRSQVVGAGLGHYGVLPPAALVTMVAPKPGAPPPQQQQPGSAALTGAAAPPPPPPPPQPASSEPGPLFTASAGGGKAVIGNAFPGAPVSTVAPASLTPLAPSADVVFTTASTPARSPWGDVTLVGGYAQTKAAADAAAARKATKQQQQQQEQQQQQQSAPGGQPQPQPGDKGGDGSVTTTMGTAAATAMESQQWFRHFLRGVPGLLSSYMEAEREACAARLTAFRPETADAAATSEDDATVTVPLTTPSAAARRLAPQFRGVGGGNGAPTSSSASFAMHPDHRREYVWQQLEALKAENWVLSLLSQAGTVVREIAAEADAVATWEAEDPAGPARVAMRREMARSLGADSTTGLAAATVASYAARGTAMVPRSWSAGMFDVSGGAAPPAAGAGGVRVNSSFLTGLSHPLLQLSLSAAGLPVVDVPPARLAGAWSAPLHRLALARALAAHDAGVDPCRTVDVPPEVEQGTLSVLTRVGGVMRQHAARRREGGGDSEGSETAAAPSSSSSSSWSAWLWGGSSPSSATSTPQRIAPATAADHAAVEALQLLPVNAAGQQSRPLTGMLRALAATAAAAATPTDGDDVAVATGDGSQQKQRTSLATPVALPVLTPRDAVMALALRASTSEPYRLLFEAYRWNTPLHQAGQLAALLEGRLTPARASLPPAVAVEHMTRVERDVLARVADTPLVYTRHWGGLLAWVRANAGGARTAFHMEREAARQAAATGGARSADSSSSDGGDDAAPAPPPFPIHVLVTELPDSRVMEHARGWPALEWHHTLAVGTGGASRVSRPLGFASPDLGGPTRAEILARLHLQSHQQALAAFWGHALPGCVTKLAPETHADVSASLKQAEPLLRRGLAVVRAYKPSLWPPFVKSTATLHVAPSAAAAPAALAGGSDAAAPPDGAFTPSGLLPRSSSCATDPFTVLSDALAYGPAQLHRPPVARVTREAVLLAERTLLQ